MTQANITTLDEAPKAAAKSKGTVAVKGQNHDDTLSGERKIVTMHVSSEEGGKHAVFVSLNGYAYQIPRAKPVELPVEVVHILENAEEDRWERDEFGAMIKTTNRRHAFNVQDAPARAAA